MHSGRVVSYVHSEFLLFYVFVWVYRYIYFAKNTILVHVCMYKGKKSPVFPQTLPALIYSVYP